MTDIGFAIAFSAGVLSFLSPCVLPLVPSYLTFVTGMSLEDLQEGNDRKATLLHSLLFVMGFSLIFILLGASASFLGQFFRAYEVWIARMGGVIIIALGLHLAGVFRLVPLMQEKRVHLANKPAGYLGTLGVGMAFGAGWTPCIGPVLGAILTAGALQNSLSASMGLLGAYALGLGVPFVLAAVFMRELVGRLKWLRHAGRPLQIVAGAVMVLMGVAIMTGKLSEFSYWLLDRFPVLGRIG